MQRFSTTTAFAVMISVALVALPAEAAFHLWHVKEVFSNHDGTVQFIELFNSSNNEEFVSGKVLRANSDGVIKNFTIPSNLATPPATANRHMLIATPGFSALTGGVAPNFTLPDPVVNGAFFNPNAASITITFVASNDAITFTGASLPKNGVDSLTDANAFGFSLGNATNISVTPNSPTNFAGAVGAVNVPPPLVPTGDYNGDQSVDAADYTIWRDNLGAAAAPKGSGADGDADGTINDGDYAFWKTKFGNDVGGAASGNNAAVLVPEPALASLSLWGLGVLILAANRRRWPRSRV
jgi:serralysin